MGDREEVDVVVVGAGLAGLTAARYIQRKDPSIKMRVLEAKNRVGGRTETLTMRTETGTDQWDVGGQWIGSTQKHALQLLKELDVGMYEQYSDGRKFCQLGSEKIRSYDTALPTMASLLQYSLTEAVDFLRVFGAFESIAQKVPVTNPFEKKELSYLDDMSVADFTRRFALSKTLEDITDCITRASFGTRPQRRVIVNKVYIAIRENLGDSNFTTLTTFRMSMLYFALYAHAGGSLTDLLEAVGTGAQRYRIKGGSQQLSKMLMADLGDEVVEMNRPLWKVQQDEAGVNLTFINSENENPQVESIRAKRVVLAIPPQQVARVQFDPPLPERKHQLFNAFPMGNLLKFIVTYETAFWRQKGYSGEIAASGTTSTPGELTAINITFDATTHHGNPAIVGFFNSEWSSKSLAERRAGALSDLARYLGEEALHCIDYLDKDWAQEPFSGGCPVSILPPGYMDNYAHIRDPDKRIHYAGTETATLWPGYMSGAIQSGRRAGAEIIKELKPHLNIPEEDLEGSVYAAEYRAPEPRKDLAYDQRSSLITPNRLILLTLLGVGGYFAAKKYGLIEGDKIDLKFVKF